MIVQSFLTLLFSQIITIVAITVVLRLISKIPPREMLLILLCLLSELLGYFFYAVNNFYSSPTKISNETVVFSQLGYFFSILAIMIVTYALILIDFKLSYQDIIELLIFSWVGGANAVYNTLTAETVLYKGNLETLYNPLGVFLIFLFFGLVIFIWSRRLLKIYRVYRQKHTFRNVLKEFSVFILIGVILIVIYIFFVINYQIHGDYSFIAGSILTIAGMGIILRNNAFLFITDIQFDSLIVVEKMSGIRLYSKIFKENFSGTKDDSDFIGSVVSAINISFSDTIDSHRDLTEMSFSNKTVLISTGDHVRSILILSYSNLIAKSISKHVVKKFEKLFAPALQEKISNNSFVSKRTDYIAFDQEVNYVRQFIPL